MVKEFKFISIKEILNRLLRHPLLQDVTLEQVIQYTVDFFGIYGLPKMYESKETGTTLNPDITITNHRGILPSDLVSITQVKDIKSGLCLKSMTDSFDKDDDNKFNALRNIELSFKTQGTCIYTSFPDGTVRIAYKAIPIDTNGYPTIPDNPNFLKALELYIKREVFTMLFDMGKISQQVLANTQQQYAWLAGALVSEFSIPSISEMESIKNAWCTLVQNTTEFNNGFRNLGTQEHIRIQ